MDGASFTEQLIGAVRGNNDTLVSEILAEKIDKTNLINTIRDPVGNGLLYTAALNGSYDVLYLLLDNDGIEIDVKNKLGGGTALHAACIYSQKGDADIASAIVDLLIECGSDVTVKDDNGKLPIDLSSNPKVVNALRGAAYAQQMADQETEGGNGEVDGEYEIDGDDEPSDEGEDV